MERRRRGEGKRRCCGIERETYRDNRGALRLLPTIRERILRTTPVKKRKKKN